MLDGVDMELIERAQRDSDEFRHLLQAHEMYETQLADYKDTSYLSELQEMERKRLQKLKLQGKDRMMAILHQYEPS